MLLLCMLEAVESELCLLEELEVIRCMLEAAEGGTVCGRFWRCRR